MGKKPVFKRPGAADPAALDAFVSGSAPAAAEPHTAAGSEVPTSTGTEVSPLPPGAGRPRKPDAWGMPRPGEKIAKLGIDLTEEVRRQFKAKAAAEGRDGADLIRQWIRQYLEG